ncbi:MAG: TRAP transporter small permease [Rhodobacterales bacterium]|jgi:TRAP-type C4-dicarboxylate transport system permease small subunit
MSASNVKTNGTTLSKLDQALFRVESALNLTAGIMVLGLVCLAVTHVLSRKLLNAPLPGFVDWVGQFMAVFAFLGIAYTQRLGGHIRMDMLVGRLKGRTLWLTETVSSFVILLLVSALVYGTFFHFNRSFDFGSPLWSRDSSIDIALPLWPAKLIVTLSLVLLWVRLVLQVWAFGRAFREGAVEPIGVPLIEDAAQLAAHEAEVLRAIG